MERYGVIYKITNTINNRCYIGQTTKDTPEIRFKEHIKLAKYGFQGYLYNSIRDHGEQNFTFEIIDIAYNQQELNLLEGVYISWFKSMYNKNGYNQTEIINGKGKRSEETKERLRVLAKEPSRIEISSNNGKKCRGIPKPNSKSKYCGVCLSKQNKWKSAVKVDKKQCNLGTFNTEEDAAKAYDIAALKHYDVGCKLNFPELREQYLQNKIQLKKCNEYEYIKSNKKSDSKIVGVSYNYHRKKWIAQLKGFKSKQFNMQEDAENYILECRKLQESSNIPVYEKYKKKSNTRVVGVSYHNKSKRWRSSISGFKEKEFQTQDEAEQQVLEWRRIQETNKGTLLSDQY